MRERLSVQLHSRVGHREVHRLLVAKGATERVPFESVRLPRRGGLRQENGDADDSEAFTTDDEEERTEEEEAREEEDEQGGEEDNF